MADAVKPSARRFFLRRRQRTPPAPEEALPVAQVEGIGPAFATKLQKAGVRTTEDLVAADAARLAAKARLPEARVRAWQDMAELIRLKGVGPQFAEALVRSRVNSIAELALQEPRELARRVQAALSNLKPAPVGVGVTPRLAKAWIAAARRAAPPPPSPGKAALRKVKGRGERGDREEAAAPEKVDGRLLAKEAKKEVERGFLHRFLRRDPEHRAKLHEAPRPSGRRLFFRGRRKMELPGRDRARARKERRAAARLARQQARKTRLEAKDAKREAARHAKAAAGQEGKPARAAAPSRRGKERIECAHCKAVFSAPAAATKVTCPSCKSLLGVGPGVAAGPLPTPVAVPAPARPGRKAAKAAAKEEAARLDGSRPGKGAVPTSQPEKESRRGGLLAFFRRRPERPKPTPGEEVLGKVARLEAAAATTPAGPSKKEIARARKQAEKEAKQRARQVAKAAKQQKQRAAAEATGEKDRRGLPARRGLLGLFGRSGGKTQPEAAAAQAKPSRKPLGKKQLRKQERKAARAAARQAAREAKLAARRARREGRETKAKAKAAERKAEGASKPAGTLPSKQVPAAAPAESGRERAKRLAHEEKERRAEQGRQAKEARRLEKERKRREAQQEERQTAVPAGAWAQGVAQPLPGKAPGVWERSLGASAEDFEEARQDPAASKELAGQKVRLVDGRSPFAVLDEDRHRGQRPRLPDGRSPFARLPEDDVSAQPPPRLVDGRSPFVRLPEDSKPDFDRLHAFGHRAGKPYTTKGGFTITEELLPAEAAPEVELGTRADRRRLAREEKERRAAARKEAKEARTASLAAAKEAARRGREERKAAKARGTKAGKAEAGPAPEPMPEPAPASGRKPLLGRFGRKPGPPASATEGEAAPAGTEAVVGMAPAASTPQAASETGPSARELAKARRQAEAARKEAEKEARRAAKEAAKAAGRQAEAEAGASAPDGGEAVPKAGFLARLRSKPKEPGPSSQQPPVPEGDGPPSAAQDSMPKPRRRLFGRRAGRQEDATGTAAEAGQGRLRQAEALAAKQEERQRRKEAKQAARQAKEAARLAKKAAAKGALAQARQEEEPARALAIPAAPPAGQETLSQKGSGEAARLDGRRRKLAANAERAAQAAAAKEARVAARREREAARELAALEDARRRSRERAAAEAEQAARRQEQEQAQEARRREREEAEAREREERGRRAAEAAAAQAARRQERAQRALLARQAKEEARRRRKEARQQERLAKALAKAAAKPAGEAPPAPARLLPRPAEPVQETAVLDGTPATRAQAAAPVTAPAVGPAAVEHVVIEPLYDPEAIDRLLKAKAKKRQ